MAVMRELVVSAAVAGRLVLLPGATPTAAAAPSTADRVKQICDMMSDDDPGIAQKRLAAITELGETGSKELVKLAGSRSPYRDCALEFLVDLRDARVVPIIRRVLRENPPSTLRRAALLGVAVFQDQPSFDKVADAFQEGDLDVKAVAALALGSLGDPRGLAMLRSALLDPAYSQIRRSLIVGIGSPGHEEGIDLLLSLSNEPGYTQSQGGRMGLVLSLASIGTERSRRAAVDMIASFPEERVRVELRYQLVSKFTTQRMASHDPSEIASIEAVLQELR